MIEGPYNQSEKGRLPAREHRQLMVVDPSVDQVTLPSLRAQFGPNVVDDSVTREALKAQLAEQAETRSRVLNSVPLTLEMLAAAREDLRSEAFPYAPLDGSVERPQPFVPQAPAPGGNYLGN